MIGIGSLAISSCVRRCHCCIEAMASGGEAEGARRSGLPEGSAGLAGTGAERRALGVLGGARVRMAGGGGRRFQRPTRRLGLNESLDMRDPEEGGGGGTAAGADARGDGLCETGCVGVGNVTGAMSGGGLGWL
jgi:hypothetical protein